MKHKPNILKFKNEPTMKRKLSNYFIVLLISILTLNACSSKQKNTTESNVISKQPPNIVFIYLDDLGYGDMSANGATELHTPNMDQLANGGVRFTNGYATSATCTPSRYGLLTGSYPWREKNAKILPGTAPLLIKTTQMTVPKMLKEKGYHTGIVGKWHLGLGTGHVNWNKKITPSPNEVAPDDKAAKHTRPVTQQLWSPQTRMKRHQMSKHRNTDVSLCENCGHPRST